MVRFITLKIEGTGFVETAPLYSKLHVVAFQETVHFSLKVDSSWFAVHLYEPADEGYCVLGCDAVTFRRILLSPI
jgi:hypothetical protein